MTGVQTAIGCCEDNLAPQNFFVGICWLRSDPGKDLDSGLVHCLEPLSLLLGILVWDGAEEAVAPAVLVDLARVPLVALIN